MATSGMTPSLKALSLNEGDGNDSSAAASLPVDEQLDAFIAAWDDDAILLGPAAVMQDKWSAEQKKAFLNKSRPGQIVTIKQLVAEAEAAIAKAKAKAEAEAQAAVARRKRALTLYYNIERVVNENDICLDGMDTPCSSELFRIVADLTVPMLADEDMLELGDDIFLRWFLKRQIASAFDLWLKRPAFARLGVLARAPSHRIMIEVLTTRDETRAAEYLRQHLDTAQGTFDTLLPLSSPEPCPLQ